MLSMGAELGQTQQGNNNAYAQDTAMSWLDWDRADERLIAFARALIALRRATPAFTEDLLLTGAARENGGPPDVEWRGAEGEILTGAQWNDGDRRFLGAFFCAGDSRAALLLNAGHQDARFRLSPPRDGKFWRCAIDTSIEDGLGERIDSAGGDTLVVAARSTVALVETA
jgi:glycogen operon protein